MFCVVVIQGYLYFKIENKVKYNFWFDKCFQKKFDCSKYVKIYKIYLEGKKLKGDNG